MFNSWNFEPGIRSIRWWVSNDGGTIRNTWKLLSSENVLFFHCSGVQWTCCLAIAICCFFILSVSSFLTALRQKKPECLRRRSCIVQIEMFWSSSGRRFFASSTVNWRFFWIYILKKVSAARKVFLLLPPPNLCFRTALLGSLLAEDKSFIIVDLALLRLQIIFIFTFFWLDGRIWALSSLLLYFPGMFTWYFHKQTPHWWSILNCLLCAAKYSFLNDVSWRLKFLQF